MTLRETQTPKRKSSTSFDGVGNRTVVTADQFRAGGFRAYARKVGWAALKRRLGMARVVYDPAHLNPAETSWRRGAGRTIATWIIAEMPGVGEGLVSSPLRFVHDTWIEPGASVGLHLHDQEEEIYYLLEGALTVATRSTEGSETVQALAPGDAHIVRIGQSHACLAGPAGARLIVVAAAPATSGVAQP